MRSFAAVLTAVLLSCNPAQAVAGLVIDHNTTIDYRIDGIDVEVVDGASPPTTVQIVEGGYIEENVLAYGSSIVQMYGGEIHDGLDVFDAGTIDITGGSVGDILRAHDSGIVSFTDGRFHDYVIADDFSTVSLAGGELWGVKAFGHSHVLVSGGTGWAELEQVESGLLANETGTIYIRGTGFNYPYGAIPVSSGTLTGVLANGDPFQTRFDISGGGTIKLVPEPSTLALLGAAATGLLALAWRRRRFSN